ncbi:14046_t:CDS:1, partial [Acaulospora colombiana]
SANSESSTSSLDGITGLEVEENETRLDSTNLHVGDRPHGETHSGRNVSKRSCEESVSTLLR